MKLKGNGGGAKVRNDDRAVHALRKRMREAVTEFPTEKRELTAEDVQTLRDAGLDELADVAKIYV
jgi:hypothetical protein